MTLRRRPKRARGASLRLPSRPQGHRDGQTWAQAGGASGAPPAASEWLFIERSRRAEPVVVELDRPAAFRPKPVGFWRGTDFHVIRRVIATRREHDAIYHRVMTDRGAFDIRHVRRMDPRTLQMWRVWELCAQLDMVRVARLP